MMNEYEYEVTFHYELVNVSTIVYITDEYVGDGENDHYTSITDKAVRTAMSKIDENIGFYDENYEGMTVTHTGTIGGME